VSNEKKERTATQQLSFARKKQSDFLSQITLPDYGFFMYAEHRTYVGMGEHMKNRKKIQICGFTVAVRI
jgi:hypothetical protein